MNRAAVPAAPATGAGFTVIGHRGARGLAPENTLRALRAGIDAGAPWLEFDVQLHPSGELLLLHDRRLERTTNGRGPLAALDLDALRDLDAGDGQRLPTLAEALACIGAQAGANIELKTAEGTAAAVAQVLEAALVSGWTPDQLLVSSFHLPELAEFHRLLPQVPVAALYSGVPLDWAASARQLGAVAINIDAEFCDARLIAEARQQGLAVNVYTVNAEDDFAWMLTLGVDGVFTDYPDRALAFLAARQPAEAVE